MLAEREILRSMSDDDLMVVFMLPIQTKAMEKY
jgi:hypothetical protein